MCLSPAKSSGRFVFFPHVHSLCWLFFWYHAGAQKDPSRSAKSAGGRLQLNTHAPYLCSSKWSDTVNWCMVVWCKQNVHWDNSGLFFLCILLVEHLKMSPKHFTVAPIALFSVSDFQADPLHSSPVWLWMIQQSGIVFVAVIICIARVFQGLHARTDDLLSSPQWR